MTVTAQIRRPRHALPSRRTLAAENLRLRDENSEATGQIRRLRAELNDAVTRLDHTAVAAAAKDKRIADLEQQLRAAEEANKINARKTGMTAPAAVRGFRPDPAETQPMPAGDMHADPTPWRATVDNPLRVRPLHQAPFATTRPATAPTELPGDTETTITLHIGHTAA